MNTSCYPSHRFVRTLRTNRWVCLACGESKAVEGPPEYEDTINRRDQHGNVCDGPRHISEVINGLELIEQPS
jgi:hypothetical protein